MLIFLNTFSKWKKLLEGSHTWFFFAFDDKVVTSNKLVYCIPAIKMHFCMSQAKAGYRYEENSPRPSTDSLNHLMHTKKAMWRVTCDMRHMTGDMWCVTHDNCLVTHGCRWSFSQHCRSLAHAVLEWRCFEDLRQNITDWIYKGMTNLFAEQPQLHQVW